MGFEIADFETYNGLLKFELRTGDCNLNQCGLWGRGEGFEEHDSFQRSPELA